MEEEIRWYLVEAVADVRGDTRRRHDVERRQQTLAHFGGRLDALVYVGAISHDERNEWFAKMLAAVGYEVPDPPPAGSARAIFVGDPARAQDPMPRSPVPEFLRSVPGPLEEIERHGVRLRVLSVELYDVAVEVRWRAVPDPDPWLFFPEDRFDLESDLLGMEEWAAEELRRKAARPLLHRVFEFTLRDDLGTEFVPRGGHRRGGGNETTGDIRFQPAVPSGAGRLTLTWQGADLVIDLGGGVWARV